MESKESNYSQISDSDSDDYESNALLHSYSSRVSPRFPVWSWILQAVMFTTSLSLFIAAIIQHRQNISNSPKTEPLNSREYQKMVQDVGQRQPFQYAGGFGTPSRWRGEPNADIDAAWDSIATPRVLAITKEDVENLDKFSNSTVLIPEAYGGGYMASIEATHQMHCLNMLRKASYLPYYEAQNPGFFHNPKHQLHLDHCIEMLRQTIMCNSDMHIITYNWVSHVTYPWPDFSINRQCRNFESLVDWTIAREARAPAGHGLLERPEGAGVKAVEVVDYVHEGF